MGWEEKRDFVEEDVSAFLEEDRWRFSNHAERQMWKRQVLVLEVLQSLASGIHRPEYDKWDEEYGSWNYAIEGETVDRRRLRVVVTFVEQDVLLVVTVITPVN